MLKKNKIKQSELIKIIQKKCECSKPTIIKRINFLIKSGVLSNNLSNIKSPVLSINKDKVEVFYDVSYYISFYFTVTIGLILSSILSYIYNNIGIVYGGLVVSLLVVIKCVVDTVRNPDRKVIYIRL